MSNLLNMVLARLSNKNKRILCMWKYKKYFLDGSARKYLNKEKICFCLTLQVLLRVFNRSYRYLWSDLFVMSFSCGQYLINMWHCEVRCAKQTIFLFVLARNQTKAWARDLRRDRKRVRERESIVGKRNSEKAVDEGRRKVAVGSRHGTSERPVTWDTVQQQWWKTSQDELAFLVAL